MQLSLLFNVIIVALSSQLVSACGCSAKYNRQNPGRTSSILNNPDAQPDLPTLPGATGQANANGLNLTNIQGDILVGMKKKQELFLFFTINDKDHFKQHLGKDILPLITSTAKLLDVKTQPITAVNIAFSQDGLNALGVSDSLHDQFFTQGQAKDANFLGDPGTENWVSIFATENVHGVFLLASDDVKNVNDEMSIIEGILGSSITEVYRLQGAARPGAFEGHEHFGFMDGISQPAVKGFTTKPLPGQITLDPGHFLVGTTGDSKQSSRPTWAAEGSFLAFRQLQQKVPEFNAFIKANALKVPGLSQQENEDLLGARMIGRWKSGAPVDLAPLKDDPTLGADPQRNNNFDFTHPGKDLSGDQIECPFSAHIRKTRPRADFSPENTANHIIRAGIPYGPEVTDAEAASGQSDPKNERGLAFVSYQSDIGNGYRFQQNTWSNNINFSFGKNDTTPGFDPIVGANNGNDRFFSGLDPMDANHDLSSKIDFVVSRGGQYFFTPSLSAIGGALSS